MKRHNLTLDLRVGGLGDNWMRLIGFYAAAALRPDLHFGLVLPKALLRVATHTFADRVEILQETNSQAITFTVRGLRSILGLALRGKRFASPYGRVVLHDAKRWNLKDRLNALGFAACDLARVVYSPPWSSLISYQGYSEVVTLPMLREISVESFVEQVKRDAPDIRRHLQSAPRSAEFEVPEGIKGKFLVFPSGTSRQFIPLDWARKNLPEAVYAFFHKDPDLETWQEAGLSVVPFYEEPADMLALAQEATATATTDSFPSHFLQSCAPRLTVMLTELASHRVISPAFSGKVIPSLAPCHPCAHLERAAFPNCQAGHPACLNWSSSNYTHLIFAALNRQQTAEEMV